MIAFEIYINGKPICTAGIVGPCALSACLSWVQRSPKSPHGKHKELNFGVGGLVNPSKDFFEWLQRDLKTGDEVTIRIVEAAKVDKPRKKRIKRATPAQIKSRKQALVRQMAKEVGWKIQTR